MATKKRKAGRPPLPKGEAKDVITPIRFQEEEKATFERAAIKSGLTFSEWVRKTLRNAVSEASS
jgi:hypothetical protein